MASSSSAPSGCAEVTSGADEVVVDPIPRQSKLRRPSDVAPTCAATNRGRAVLNWMAPLKRTHPRLLQLALLAAAGALVLGLAGYTALSLQPRGNPSGQASSDPNQRCAPSPCGAPDGFEVDVTNVRPMDDHLAITVVFRNHTKSQLFEAVSY